MKGLDYQNERYVRLFVRDTPDWLLLGWEAQALYCLLMRKLDRAGVLELGHHQPARAVAAVTGLPLEMVERALPALVGPGGPFELREGFVVDPEFIDGQEARQSDAARQRAARERRRDQARAAVLAADVTKRDGSVGAVPAPPPGGSNGAAADEVEPDGTDTKPVTPVTIRDGTDTKPVETVTPSQPSRAEPSQPAREGGQRPSVRAGLLPESIKARDWQIPDTLRGELEAYAQEVGLTGLQFQDALADWREKTTRAGDPVWLLSVLCRFIEARAETLRERAAQARKVANGVEVPKVERGVDREGDVCELGEEERPRLPPPLRWKSWDFDEATKRFRTGKDTEGAIWFIDEERRLRRRPPPGSASNGTSGAAAVGRSS